MIIACDLDRTLLPNGEEPDDNSLARLYSTLEHIDHTLIYVTGRNIDLVHDAYEEFGLRTPNYLLASVGTMVYVRQGDELILDPEWKPYVYSNHPSWDRDHIVSALETSEKLYLQEPEVQNEFKISLYADLEIPEEDIRAGLQGVLQGIDGVEVIYSVDPHKQLGLVDILPETATKLGALEYVRNKLDQGKEEVVYAGDSGNDILPLTFGYKAIVVKNAPEQVKAEVLRIAETRQITDKVYVATGIDGESGYYASGVIEGIRHFL